MIYAAVKPTAQTLARRMRALQVFNDPNRQFVASHFLRLEVLPMAKFFGKKREVKFYQTFFAGVTLWADDAALIEPALLLGRHQRRATPGQLAPGLARRGAVGSR